MIFSRKVLGLVASFLIIMMIGSFFFYKKLKPIYNGKLNLTGISDLVKVYFDDIGVPHINASNSIDAYIALGYVHAQDRLWQMELTRRVAAGRLAEIFGKDFVSVDKFFLGIGIEERIAQNIERVNQNSLSFKMAMAYLNGVNQFIEKGPKPIEFYMLGIDKEKYTLKDIYNVFAYMAFSFALAHKTDPMLTAIKEKLGKNYLKELIEADYSNLTSIENYSCAESSIKISKAINTIIDRLPVASFIGSNSWVIGKEKTKSGKVLFANDPHIAYSQPSVWYQSHIKTPDYEMYGYNLALTPFPLLGHNRNYAYGVTMFQNDDIDFYVEENIENDDMCYKTKNGIEKYKLINKSIKVKGGQTINYQVKFSQHGPIINNLIDHIKGPRPISMQWIYTKLDNDLLEAAYQLSHSNSISQFKKGAALLHSPGLNLMYGDVKDNIAWFGAGKLYKYREGLYRKVFLNGVSGKDEIIEFLEFDKNPQAINPEWGYVYSANNQPDSIAGILYPGYYLPEDRAKRIVDLLKDKSGFTKEDMIKMICDIRSVTAPDIIDKMFSCISSQDLSEKELKVLHLLKAWNGDFGKNNIEPVIYNRVRYEFMKNTFKDEMKDVFYQFMNTPFEEKVLANQVKKEESIWWDDLNTKNKKETKKDIVLISFKKAVEFLENQLGKKIEEWKWKRVASVEHEHVIGKLGGVFRKIFNVGPYQPNGGDQVINNKIYNIDSTGYYKVYAGPSTRRIIDFSNIENSISIIPTGQSGNIFSPYYRDQKEEYHNGLFVKMKLNQTEIENSKNILVFLPD